MVRVDSKGRIVLPSEIRDRLGIREGTEVTVETQNGRVIVEPEEPPEEVMHALETMVEEAARKREHRREAPEGARTADEDPISAKQREIIRKGASRDEQDERE